MKCSIVPVTPYQQNCSILVCEKTMCAALVDPSGEVPRLRAEMEELGVTLEKVFLTHARLDHCAGADIVRKGFRVPIEGPHIEDKFWLDSASHGRRRVLV